MNAEHCGTWEDIAATEHLSGLVKRAIEGKDVSLVTARRPAGTKDERHSHLHEQFVQVVECSGTLETKQGERAFAAGSVFHFQADAWRFNAGNNSNHPGLTLSYQA